MSDDPQITPMPYLDPQSLAAYEAFGKLTGGKSLSDFPIPEQRELFDKFQAPVPVNSNIETSTFDVSTSYGQVKTYLYKPKSAKHDLPIIYHIHGGGWTLGDAKVYTAFSFDLVERTGFAVVFPEYTLAPEKQFPAQQEQCVEVLQYVLQHGKDKGLKTDKIVVSGDSAGGQLACAVSIISHQRNLHFPIAHQFLLQPLVDITSFIRNYSEWTFQAGPLLTTPDLEQFAAAFAPRPADRATITASPAQLTAAQAKAFLPATTVVTSQQDWLRDQGENFARMLQAAGVPCGVVQMLAVLHDVEVLKSARDSPTVRFMMAGLAQTIKEVLASDGKC